MLQGKKEINMKKIIASIVLIIMVIVAGVCFNNFQSGSADTSATVEGYVKKVCSDSSTILICDDFEDISDKEYLGDYLIRIEEYTVISDGRTLDSIEQGDYIIVTYTGTLAETWPVQIDGVTAITVNSINLKNY